MHVFLDIRTLSLFSGLISACLFVGMTYIYKNRKTYPGFKQWTLAFMLNFLGFLFLSMRNIFPDVITVILSNTLIVICFVLIARGLIHFAEGRQHIAMDVIPPVVLMAALFYFVYFSPNVNARIVALSATLAIISLRCALITHRDITALFGEKNGLLTAAFSFVAFWLFLRASLTILVEENIHDFMVTGAIQGFSIIAGQIGHIFIAIGLIMINAQRLENDLVGANREIKTLRGFLPICSYCKKIRDDSGYWNQIESYISTHSDAEFSHGICPECAKRLFPEFDLDED